MRIARNIEGGTNSSHPLASPVCSAVLACIGRKVIPGVRPPVCCVQYGISITDIASIAPCTQ